MSTTKTVGMTLAKADAQDFRTMWKVSKAFQNLQWADTRLRERRLKMVLVGRLDQLGTGGFMRIVMGCEMLIGKVCDPAVDHYALKPVYGAAPELLAALQCAVQYMPPGHQAANAHNAIANALGAPA